MICQSSESIDFLVRLERSPFREEYKLERAATKFGTRGPIDASQWLDTRLAPFLTCTTCVSYLNTADLPEKRLVAPFCQDPFRHQELLRHPADVVPIATARQLFDTAMD